MNKNLFLIPIVLGIAAVVSLSLIFVSEEPSESQSPSIYDQGFTYYDIEIIQTTLSEQNITVSIPVAITDHTISQYCMIFENKLPQKIDYCTTTNVIDSEGNPLGNINMGGNTNSPILAIANLETTNLESNQDDVLSVIEVMIETLVCDCWEEEKSDDDLESISAWVDAVYNFYNDSGQRSVKSQVDDLGTSVIILEVTSKENSILHTLIIQK
jgi:hypothetical protein